MKQVKIYSRMFMIRMIESLARQNKPLPPNTAIISIQCPEEDLLFPENKDTVLSLKFHDIENEMEGTRFVRFNKDHAKQIISFLEKHQDKETFIVHCAAGVSRSGAVGLFINDYFGLDYSDFKKQNPHIVPSVWIGKVLREENLEGKF